MSLQNTRSALVLNSVGEESSYLLQDDDDVWILIIGGVYIDSFYDRGLAHAALISLLEYKNNERGFAC